MAEFIATFYSHPAREASQSDMHRQHEAQVRQLTALPTPNSVGTVRSSVLNDLLGFPVPLTGTFFSGGFASPIQSVKGLQRVAAGGPYWVQAINGPDFWTVDGPPLANGGNPISEPAAPIPWGRVQPGMCIVYSSDVLTALQAGPTTTSDGDFCFTYGDGGLGMFHSPFRFCEFSFTPEDGIPIGTGVDVTRILTSLERGAARYPVGAGFASDCGFTALVPEGRVWIRATDIGGGAFQIPADVTGNTAAKFRAFPGVFFRRGRYWRNVVRNMADVVALNAGLEGSQPVRISVVSTAPTSSDWMLVIDGSVQLVQLVHPPGSDMRTPLEIWNGLLAPAIRANAGGSASRLLYAPLAAGLAGGLVGAMDRLAYLEYARHLRNNGTTTDTTQTGTDIG